jgi:hypothetical protein
VLSRCQHCNRWSWWIMKMKILMMMMNIEFINYKFTQDYFNKGIVNCTILLFFFLYSTTHALKVWPSSCTRRLWVAAAVKSSSELRESIWVPVTFPKFTNPSLWSSRTRKKSNSYFPLGTFGLFTGNACTLKYYGITFGSSGITTFNKH